MILYDIIWYYMIIYDIVMYSVVPPIFFGNHIVNLEKSGKLWTSNQFLGHISGVPKFVTDGVGSTWCLDFFGVQNGSETSTQVHDDLSSC